MTRPFPTLRPSDRVAGYHGSEQAADALAAEGQKIGYPLMIKASAGGGGKGMRVVPRQDDFLEALQAARREAKAASGDEHVLLERCLADRKSTRLHSSH